jgi:PhnB protein
MLGVKPYITFPGNCEEAVAFYQQALGAELLFMQKVGDSPMADMGPADKVMHCTLRLGDTHIMASDNLSPMPTNVGNNISLAVGSDDIPAAEKMFDAIAEGGHIIMPMGETYWAERFGMVTDKFGIHWMFNCEKTGTDHQEATA